MDSLKKATGLGLSPLECYTRAYEKAVLLGPAHFGKAAELFAAAATKAHEASDLPLAARARANAALYGFVGSGSEAHLPALRDALAGLDRLEQVGSRTDFIDVSTLRAETEARLLESQVERLRSDDYTARAPAHARVAAAFQQIFSADLITYRHHPVDRHPPAGSARFFLHQGMSHWYEALRTVPADPEAAADEMAKAVAALRQCDDARASDAETWLGRFRQRRTCWVCQREFQGAVTHFNTFAASVKPHAEAVVRELGQDSSSLSAAQAVVVLCTPCSSAVDNIADARVIERTKDIRVRLEAAESALLEVVERTRRLEIKVAL